MKNSNERDKEEVPYQIAAIIYIVILILTLEWQVRNFEVWADELVWPTSFEPFQFVILVLGLCITSKKIVDK